MEKCEAYLVFKHLLYFEGHAVSDHLPIFPDIVHQDTSYRHHLGSDGDLSPDRVQFPWLDDDNRLLCRVWRFDEAELGTGRRWGVVFVPTQGD